MWHFFNALLRLIVKDFDEYKFIKSIEDNSFFPSNKKTTKKDKLLYE